MGKLSGADLIEEYDREMAAGRKMLEALPGEGLDWAPHEKSMTLGRLASHLTEIPMWGTTIATTEELDMSTFEGPPADYDSKAEILEAYDREVASARSAIRGCSADDLDVVWTLRAGDQIYSAEPRDTTLRTWVFSHLIHHRGQLGVYLRLLDLPVPGMYGPSADEMEAMEG